MYIWLKTGWCSSGLNKRKHAAQLIRLWSESLMVLIQGGGSLKTADRLFKSHCMLYFTASLLSNTQNGALSGMVSAVEKHCLSQKHDNCFLFGWLSWKCCEGCSCKKFLSCAPGLQHRLLEWRLWLHLCQSSVNHLTQIPIS